jgi:hypothetical protein
VRRAKLSFYRRLRASSVPLRTLTGTFLYSWGRGGQALRGQSALFFWAGQEWRLGGSWMALDGVRHRLCRHGGSVTLSPSQWYGQLRKEGSLMSPSPSYE